MEKSEIIVWDSNKKIVPEQKLRRNLIRVLLFRRMGGAACIFAL